MLLGELRKRERRRILPDPAPKLLKAGILRHPLPLCHCYGVATVTVFVVVVVRPAVSMTVKRTV